MTKNMQAAFSSGGGAPGQGMDPSQYMQAMQQMMQDPSFVEYSEKLYSNMMKDPMMARVMQSMQNPNARSQMESRMAQLKEDPELKHVIEDMEKAGPAAALGAAAAQEEVVEEEVDLHGAVSSSDLEACKELLKLGADVNEKDEEGRSALHFACGYGELECAE